MSIPGQRDINYQILLRVPIGEISKLCSVNKQYADLCSQDSFWKDKFNFDFPYVPISGSPNTSWKQLYRDTLMEIRIRERIAREFHNYENYKPVGMSWNEYYERLIAGNYILIAIIRNMELLDFMLLDNTNRNFLIQILRFIELYETDFDISNNPRIDLIGLPQSKNILKELFGVVNRFYKNYSGQLKAVHVYDHDILGRGEFFQYQIIGNKFKIEIISTLISS